MIECVLFGTGGMMPMPYRFLVSLAVRIEGQALLFDCGEGTQIPIKMSRIGIKPIQNIFISHMHADHVTGLPGLLMMLNQAAPDGTVRIYGPRGIDAYVRAQETTLRFERDYPLEIIELDEEKGVAMDSKNFEVVYHVLRHRIRCLGYSVVEKPRPGRFKIGAAKELGIPEGPAWGKLQRGENVELPDGSVVGPKDVLGPSRPGRKITYITDTIPCPGVYYLADGADLLFIEGMFEHELADEAKEKWHQTAVQAAKQAKKSGAARAVLIHYSPRYRNDEISRLVTQARTVYDVVEGGRDGARYELKVKD